jgi:hypothetical protein
MRSRNIVYSLYHEVNRIKKLEKERCNWTDHFITAYYEYILTQNTALILEIFLLPSEIIKGH